MPQLTEVRWHGRGGQGAKTAGYVLAVAAADGGIIPTIQNRVKSTASCDGKRISPPKGLATSSIRRPKSRASPAASTCPRSCGRAVISLLSSYIPRRKRRPSPAKIPTSLVSSLGSVLSTRRRLAIMPAMRPRKRAIPPRRGVGRRCRLRGPGRSRKPYLTPSLPARGVAESETQKPIAKISKKIV